VVGRSLAVSLFESGGELDLDGGNRGLARIRGAGEGRATDGGSDLERAGDLGESHFIDMTVGEVVEEAMDSGEDLLGGVPFMFAELGGAAGPIGSLFGAEGGFRFSLLLEEAGIESVDAIGPPEAAGPFFDGADLFIEEIGDGVEGASVAEVEEGHKSAERPGRFGRETGEVVGCSMLDAGCLMIANGSWMPGSGFWMVGTAFRRTRGGSLRRGRWGRLRLATRTRQCFGILYNHTNIQLTKFCLTGKRCAV